MCAYFFEFSINELHSIQSSSCTHSSVPIGYRQEFATPESRLVPLVSKSNYGLDTPTIVSVDTRGMSSCSPHRTKKSISTVELDDYVVVVGKAVIGIVDCCKVSNNSLINDPGDCTLPSHDPSILWDILNVFISNVGAPHQVCKSVLMNDCDIAVERGFKPNFFLSLRIMFSSFCSS